MLRLTLYRRRNSSTVSCLAAGRYNPAMRIEGTPESIELAKRLFAEVQRAYDEHPNADIVDFLNELRANYCMECGGRAGCQCWNDE